MIASLGESLIDEIGNETFVGGCPLNTALAAARLNCSVSYFGKISSDEYGQRILELLIDNCVLFDPFLCNSDKKTMVASSFVGQDGVAKYSFSWKDSAAVSITKEELQKTYSNNTDIDCVFIGSLALVMQPCKDQILQSIDYIKPDPMLYLDPNVRPTMIENREEYKAFILKLCKKCAVVKLSEEDLGFLFPNEDKTEAEKKLFSNCLEHLIVTRGSKGSSWYAKTLGIKVDKELTEKDKVEVVDTVGCGDTFSGTLLSFFQKNNLFVSPSKITENQIKQALDLATKAAAINCTRRGCNPPFLKEL